MFDQMDSMRKLACRFFALTILLSMPMFVGCPDYSHLRDEPDYKNMTDGGAEAPEDGEENAE